MTKSEVQSIRISEYNYNLPEFRIPKYPLSKRNNSKLLIYKDGNISSKPFNSISSIIPEGSLVVFNNTRVIHARLFFKKPTGSVIEVFCLSPNTPHDYQINFQQRKSVVWNCMIGNAKRWKNDSLYVTISIDGVDVILAAKKISKTENDTQVEFTWDNDNFSFSELLDAVGNLPIPPYLNREAEPDDDETYQTVYSKVEGSVAAPTAGLHFTPEVMSDLQNKNIQIEYLTLHVGAGTFKPVKSETILEHQMHSEFISVSRQLVLSLLNNIDRIVVVGTTSMRTIESLYYIGKQIIDNPGKRFSRFYVSQWEPYEEVNLASPAESLEAIIQYLDEFNEAAIYAETEIIIVPGYTFHFPSAIVTNFHQPKSTLLLLISAFVGEAWRDIYNFALDNEFRFLSYGDSSILFKG